MTEQPRVRILFVCMGNICRSPLAEGVFRHHATARGVARRFEIDSAGTGGWHAGERPDARMQAVAAARGVVLESRARQIRAEDLGRFDHVLCMDEENLRDVLRLGGAAPTVRLLLDHHPSAPTREVPDPYYGGSEGFATVYELVDVACTALLDELLAAARA